MVSIRVKLVLGLLDLGEGTWALGLPAWQGKQWAPRTANPQLSTGLPSVAGFAEAYVLKG